MKRIVLKPGRERSFDRRHPWIFSGAVASGEAGLGELVELVSSSGEFLGVGAYSPASQIRVRVLSFMGALEPDWLKTRVAAAIARRADILSSGYTNAVRLINAESDGLPGVVADCYDGWVVCQLTSAGADVAKAELADALMQSVPDCRGVAERADVEVRAKEGLPMSDFSVLAGAEPPALIEIHEGVIRFFVDVRKGHKTGFYLDQREARRQVATFAKGATVLNCFSYTGGFGLAARAAGARKVTQVDISGDALALAQKNAALSNFPETKMEYVEADVFQYLRACRDANKKFDLIVLDPPKFAAVKSQLMKAARGYKDINLLAMKLLAPKGVLATFSCSGAMDTELFDKVLGEAAADAKRDFQIVARTHPGSDHPVGLNFPEGEYLKGVILRSLL